LVDSTILAWLVLVALITEPTCPLDISIRDAIFREVASNILIHREYLNPFPAKLIIENGQVRTENSNKPHGFGLINPARFSPLPKNPVIARFFREIGRADELGLGEVGLIGSTIFLACRLL
jgi:hypothetical protein